MASVINSARTSTASVFDAVTTFANVANNSLGAAALGIDALNLKAGLMHKGVAANTRAKGVNVVNHEIVNAAVEHADFMQEIFKRTNPAMEFDWTAIYNAAVIEIEAAVKAA
jgi:hypothetical protein